jgi:Tol biopolymer transport system component
MLSKFFLWSLALGVLSLLLVGGAWVSGATWMRGAELAYVSYHQANAEIHIIDVARGLVRNLTDSPAYDVQPVWSPDGAWIAFSSDRDGRRGIFVMDPLGGSVRRLTDADNSYGFPRWSVDGQRLVFTALNEPPGTLYSVDFDGSNLVQLIGMARPGDGIVIDLASEVGNQSLAASPDGSRIAFMTYRNDAWGIYISRDASRRNAQLLVNVGYFTETPVWSPDGEQMAFIARDGSIDLFVVDLASGTPHRLTTNREIDASPSWRP